MQELLIFDGKPAATNFATQLKALLLRPTSIPNVRWQRTIGWRLPAFRLRQIGALR